MRVIGKLCAMSLVVVVGCAGDRKHVAPKSDAARAQSTAVVTAGAVVGHFETPDHRITWLATDAGPRFTVADLDGAVLAANLTEAEVAERFPELAAFTRGAHAKLEANPSGGEILDASGPDDFRNGYVGPD